MKKSASFFLSFLVTALTVFSTFSAKAFAFSDVPADYVQKEAIDYVLNQGFVNGYIDGTYRPFNTINRADFSKITMSALLKNQIGELANCFVDVRNEYFAKYVCAAKNIGIVRGYADLKFHPEANINLAEALKILLEAKKVTVPEAGGLWFQKYLNYAEQNGVLTKIAFHNWDHFVDRGEMARLIYNLQNGAVAANPPVNNPPVNNPPVVTPPVVTPPVDQNLPVPAPTSEPAFDAKYSGLKTKIEAVLIANKVPGASVAFVVGDKIVWASGIGTTEVGSNKPVTLDTMFQGASISKPLTALAALRLVEKGSLALDVKVAPYLKSVTIPGADKITLRQLLSHSAGVNIHGFIGYLAGATVPTLKQILLGQAPANTPPIQVVSAPGTFVYSGGGYLVLQQILMDAVNMSFQDLMSGLVFSPLQMTHSTFGLPVPANLIQFASSGHTANSAVLPGKWTVYPEFAADGVWTTPSDLAKFVIAIQKANAATPGAILKKTTVTDMLTLQTAGGIGLGLYVQGNTQTGTFFHGGVNNGFKNSLGATMMPNNALIIMTNSDNGNTVFGPIKDLVTAAYNSK